VATAARTGVAFYMSGLILLPMLAFVGLATFHRGAPDRDRGSCIRAPHRAATRLLLRSRSRWPASCPSPRNGCPPQAWGSACGSNS
jgi:hypothetical protein